MTMVLIDTGMQTNDGSLLVSQAKESCIIGASINQWGGDIAGFSGICHQAKVIY